MENQHPSRRKEQMYNKDHFYLMAVSSPLALHRAQKIFEFLLALGASNSQILIAQGTSPLAHIFKPINYSWPKMEVVDWRFGMQSAHLTCLLVQNIELYTLHEFKITQNQVHCR